MVGRSVAAALLVCGLVVGRARAQQPAVADDDEADGARETGEPLARPQALSPGPTQPPSPSSSATSSSSSFSAAKTRTPRAQPVALAPLPAGPINPFAITPRAGRVAGGGSGRESAPPETEASDLAGDTRPRNNLVFLELGGNGILYTVNYDRAIAGGFTFRVGLGQVLEGANPIATRDNEIASADALGVPLLVNFVRGERRHRLELGAGVTLLHASARSATRYRAASPAGTSALATALIGYRYVPPGGGFTYRAGFTPLVSRAGVFPWAGLSFGYSF